MARTKDVLFSRRFLGTLEKDVKVILQWMVRPLGHCHLNHPLTQEDSWRKLKGPGHPPASKKPKRNALKPIPLMSFDIIQLMDIKGHNFFTGSRYNRCQKKSSSLQTQYRQPCSRDQQTSGWLVVVGGNGSMKHWWPIRSGSLFWGPKRLQAGVLTPAPALPQLFLNETPNLAQNQ